MAHVQKTTKRGKNGKLYRYWYYQTPYRVGKKVKTHSTYIGPVGMAFGALRVAAKMANDKHLRDRVFKELDLKKQAARDRIDKQFAERPVQIGDLRVGKFSAETFETEGKKPRL